MSRLRQIFVEELNNPLHDAEGDEVVSRNAYRLNTFSCFLAKALDALRADGIPSEHLRCLLKDHADELSSAGIGPKPPHDEH